MRITPKDIIWIAGIFLIVSMISRFSCNTPKEINSQPTETIRTIQPPQESETSRTINYSIGSVDPRFNIPKHKLLELIREAEGILEGPFGRSFYEYDERSPFKINLLYDDRQKEYDEAQILSSALQQQNASFNELISKFEILKETIQTQKEQYENNAAALKNKMSEYDSKVSYWNSKGGAPKIEFSALQQEREQLNSEAKDIEQELLALNSKIAEQNDLLGLVNDYAKKYNFEAEKYNGTYVKKREFEKGVYNGSEINIYQYKNDADLRLVIAHELGHAIGLDHARDPGALMYPFLEKQNINDFRLTNEDKELIRNSKYFKQY